MRLTWGRTGLPRTRWMRGRHEPVREVNHTAPLPDGDVVLGPERRRWADLLAEPTRPPPVVAVTGDNPRRISGGRP